MYKRRNNFKARASKSSDYMDNTTYTDKGRPVGDYDVKSFISAKALRSLPHSSYSIQADPYDASLPTSRPYPILNAFNKKVGGHYAGVENLDGGNVQQYPNSLTSNMLEAFDYFKLNLSVNYRFRPMRLTSLPSSVGPDNDYTGSGLVDQCRQAVAEAVSVLQSTTFTQMGIYNYCVETDLPMGKALRSDEEFIGPGEQAKAHHYVYKDISDVIYATTLYYQIFLQEALHVINYHNAFRLKMGTMIRTSWNRETPTLNNLFGLFKKKSFLSVIDSLCLSFPGEYIDTEWAKQVNMITSMMSRRSDSFLDPILEIQGSHVRPSVFRIYITDQNGNIIKDASDKADPLFDVDRDLTKQVLINQTPTNVTFYDAVDYLNEYLSAYQVVAWARNHQNYQDADIAYFNAINTRLQVISLCMTTFKVLFNDVREVLDVVSRTGINTWQKGFRPSITKDTDAPLFDNRLVDDIYKTVFSGAMKLRFNNNTKRMETFSLWGMYDGIPEFDAMSGGCFLTLSGKDIDIASDTDGLRRHLPIMCYYDSSIVGSSDSGVRIQAVNRKGVTAYIKAKEYAFADDPNLCRLAPLASQNPKDSNNHYIKQLRVPKLYATGNGVLNNAQKSYLCKACTTIFGLCENTLANNAIVSVDPDLVAIYNIELSDITNEAIAYARATGPFKGSYGYEGDIGFTLFGQKA